MRIIAGEYRGRQINAPDSSRPTLDRVRENLFNILGPSIRGARVLDLFGGSGALGIEAISRGATADICDIDSGAIKMIRANLSLLKATAGVYHIDYKRYLENTSNTYDYIFVDPPYESEYIVDILNIVKDRGLLNSGGVIVYEHSSDKKVDIDVEGYFVKDTRKYGHATLTFIKEDL